MPLPFKIAIRFLKFSKGQTILITLGIAIGVSVQLFIGLLINGLQTSLIDKTIGSSAHITITQSVGDKTIDNYESLINDIDNNEDVTYVSAAFDRPAFVTVGGNSESVLVRGLTLDQANNIYKISSALTEGNMPEGNNEVVIGKGFAALGDYKTGDSIILAVPNIGNKEIIISGIFDLKISAINKTWFITNILTAQSLFETGQVASSIEIQIADVFASDVVMQDIVLALPEEEGLTVVDWQSQNEELLSGLNGQSLSSIMIQVFVIIAVVLGIASVLAISVMQKSRQIGILKAMGIKDTKASIIFLTQGFLLGIMGAIAGILLGLALSIVFTKFALNPDGTALIPLSFNAGFIIMSGAIALIASMGASLIPALKTSKLNPIEVIRNG